MAVDSRFVVVDIIVWVLEGGVPAGAVGVDRPSRRFFSVFP